LPDEEPKPGGDIDAHDARDGRGQRAAGLLARLASHNRPRAADPIVAATPARLPVADRGGRSTRIDAYLGWRLSSGSVGAPKVAPACGQRAVRKPKCVAAESPVRYALETDRRLQRARSGTEPDRDQSVRVSSDRPSGSACCWET